MTSDHYGKPKFTKISEIPAKYMPPRPEGASFAETPETLSYIITYANNMRQAEQDAKLAPKRQEEELKK